MGTQTDLIRQETHTKTSDRSSGPAGLPVFLFTILAALVILTAGIFISEKLVAQDSVQELETQVKQANGQDQFTFFDTLSDRKVNIRPRHRICSPGIHSPALSAHVQQSPLKTDTATALIEHPSSGEVSGRGYTIQVSADRMQDEAEKTIRALRTRGYLAYLAKENLVDGQGLWYRVRIGRFSVRTEAEKRLRELSERAGLRGGFVIPSTKNSQDL